jgi:hypothetical protein
VATSTLRAAIIVAAVVLGAVVLANAFPNTGAIGPGPVQTTTGSPGPSNTSGPSPSPSLPPIEGAVVQVLNGTHVDNLAADTAACLETAGVVIASKGTAADNFAQTTLFFAQGKKLLAEALQKRFFLGAKLQQGKLAGTPANVEVTVVLGADYQPAAECQTN